MNNDKKILTPISTKSSMDNDSDFVPMAQTTSPSIQMQDSNFVFFFGTAESGKSVILSSMLYYLSSQAGVLRPKLDTPNSKEAEVLLFDFLDNIRKGVLPNRTTRDRVTRIDLIFEPNNKSKKVPPIKLTFLETSGENHYEIRRGGNYHSSIDEYLNANIPLNFILVTDYVQLSTGEEGYIEDITWRNTTIRTMANHIVIVPNSKISTNALKNYNFPDTETPATVSIGISYDCDLEYVEKVAIEVAQATMSRLEGAVENFTPVVRFNSFEESSIKMTVIMRAKTFSDQFLIKHEFMKDIHKKFRDESIEIPFPTRTMIMKTPQEMAVHEE